MPRTSSKVVARPREFAAHFHLLGTVDYEDCLSVQRRLAYDALTRDDGRIAVLLCEHPPLVTIGRGGSRAHVRLSGEELSSRQLAIRYVGRGGGAILHGPGQLAIYPIVPLDWHGWTIGVYLRRLQTALQAALRDLNIASQAVEASHSLRGRQGVLAMVAAAVRHGVTSHGAYLNVHPDLRDQGRIEPIAGLRTSSILSERSLPVRMQGVRATLVARLAAALDCERHHLHTGHPLLADLAPSPSRESAA
jgi:lipoyl(octanoyl) transferase